MTVRLQIGRMRTASRLLSTCENRDLHITCTLSLLGCSKRIAGFWTCYRVKKRVSFASAGKAFFVKKKAQRGEPLHFQASVEAFRTIVIFNSKGKKLEPFDECYSSTYAAPCLSFFYFFIAARGLVRQAAVSLFGLCMPLCPPTER